MQFSRTQRLLSWTAFGILMLTGVVLGIRQLREPDLWWQLRTGEWIVEHGKVMHEDIFSFTFPGVEWINVKWGFEVFLSIFSWIGGPEFMLVLQVVANVLILYFLYRSYKGLYSGRFQDKLLFPTVSFLIIAYIILWSVEFRLNGRPEMVSHVMSMVFLFFLLRYHYSPGKFIYWLVPLQVLWANLHEAFGIGVVMLIAFTGAAWFEYLFLKKYTSKIDSPKLLSIACLLVVLAPALHANGPRMILHPFEIFSQVSENKFTSELLSFRDSSYWQKEAYINIGVFILALIGLYMPDAITKRPRDKKGKAVRQPVTDILMSPVKRYGAGYIAFLLMFFYLGLTAYRNIPFSVLISAPLALVALDAFSRLLTSGGRTLDKLRLPGYAICILIGMTAYMAIVSNYYYKDLDDGRDKYGFKTDPVMNPIGAAEFIQSNKIAGPAFSDFLVPNYLLWALQPGYKTFIDLRDLDIFPAEFFDKFAYLNYQPEKFIELDTQYRFNYAVLYRANFQTLHRYFAAQSDWALVYADPVAAIYLKRNRMNAATIAKYENKDVFYEPAEMTSSGLSRTVSVIFNPSYEPQKDEKLDHDLIAADYYRNIGRYEMAEKRAKRSANNHIQDWRGYQMLGDIYLEQLNKVNDTAMARKYRSAAVSAYNNALMESDEAIGALVGQARIDIRQGNYMMAESRLQQALQKEKKNRDIYLLLAQLQNIQAAQAPDLAYRYLELRVEYLQKAYDLDPEDLYVQFYLGLDYAKLGHCDEAEKYLTGLLKFPGVSESDRETAKGLLFQCGVRF